MKIDPVRVIQEQHKALQMALNVTALAGNPREAIRLIRAITPHVEPENVVETVAAHAMAYIAKVDPPKGDPSPILSDLAPEVSTLCAAAERLLRGEPVDSGPLREIAGLPAREEAVHMMALRFWAGALVAISEKNFPEARRLFARSHEVAGSFGVESQPAIGWTYVAFFMPR